MVDLNNAGNVNRLPAGPRRESVQDCTEPHRVLGISRHETDPVLIILAAQIRLRRWRRLDPAEMVDKHRLRVQKIVGAREAMMRRAVMRLAASGTAEPLLRTV